MCGILGNFGLTDKEHFLAHVSQVAPTLNKRGPDQQNTIDLVNFLAVHSRLIVQGSKDDGLQPMTFRNIAILFNGNLYNKNILKLELESLGYQFKGVSDTEIVAVSIFHWGNEAFNKFNGFFAIASFNIDNKTLTLARDRLGQKPLYYASHKQSLYFGSTENMIPSKYRGDIRKESFLDFITFGFIPAPNTMFQNLFSLEPGSYKEFSFSNQKILEHDTVYFWEPKITNEIDDFNEAIEVITTSIDESIEDGLNASIDVACLFSGGVDSSLIFSYARNINKDICAITADFGENDDAEFRASSVARVLSHQNHLVRKIASEDVTNSLKLTTQICESPFDDTSIIPSNIVFASVRDSGYSVALTGDGADELFCGYSSFGNLKKIERFLDSRFDFFIRYPGKLLNSLISSYKGADLARFFMYEDELLMDLLCNGFKTREWGKAINADYDPMHYLKNILNTLNDYSPMDKLRILNLRFKLPYQMLFKVDRASMHNSVEARPLFLNNKIVDSALNISSKVMLQNGQKSLLKQIYKTKIAHSGWSLPKTGFGWKTDSYDNLFTQEDNQFLLSQADINGLDLLKNRKRHHKRGYYGLFSLVSWLKHNT